VNRNGHRIRTILAISFMAVVVAACSTSGGLGTIPPEPRTPAPSVEPGPPDMTPEPSPSATPTPTPGATPNGSPVETPKPTPTPASGDTMVIRAYFVLDGDVGVEGLVPTLRDVPETTAVARAAMETLLRGEILADYPRLSTAIPAGTRLLGLSIKDGVATVNLSREFESGGGSASAFRRLGQVVYTLTQFSTVRSVLFQVEGRTVTTFGSEGIVLEGPQARNDFVDILPSIFVDRPAYGAAAGNPARVTGNADVFEATFRIAILDGAGRKLADQQAMATCGTGCRGTFDVTVRYDVAKAQWGTLRTYFGSAKDGSPTDVRDYPVWLTPAD
jgi:spore germination protein GerM